MLSSTVRLGVSFVVVEMSEVFVKRVLAELSFFSNQFLEGGLEAGGAVLGNTLLLLGLEIVVVLGISPLESLKS